MKKLALLISLCLSVAMAAQAQYLIVNSGDTLRFSNNGDSSEIYTNGILVFKSDTLKINGGTPAPGSYLRALDSTGLVDWSTGATIGDTTNFDSVATTAFFGSRVYADTSNINPNALLAIDSSGRIIGSPYVDSMTYSTAASYADAKVLNPFLLYYITDYDVLIQPASDSSFQSLGYQNTTYQGNPELQPAWFDFADSLQITKADRRGNRTTMTNFFFSNLGISIDSLQSDRTLYYKNDVTDAVFTTYGSTAVSDNVIIGGFPSIGLSYVDISNSGNVGYNYITAAANTPITINAANVLSNQLFRPDTISVSSIKDFRTNRIGSSSKINVSDTAQLTDCEIWGNSHIDMADSTNANGSHFFNGADCDLFGFAKVSNSFCNSCTLSVNNLEYVAHNDLYLEACIVDIADSAQLSRATIKGSTDKNYVELKHGACLRGAVIYGVNVIAHGGEHCNIKVFGTSSDTLRLDSTDNVDNTTFMQNVRINNFTEAQDYVFHTDSNGNGTWRIPGIETGDIIGDSIELQFDKRNYVFSGIREQWLLQHVDSTTDWQRITIKSRGTDTLTLITAGGANQIYTDAAVNSYDILPGESIDLISDGFYYLVE